MTEKPYDVVAFGYAGKAGEDLVMNPIPVLGISQSGLCDYIRHVTWEWWDHVAIRLRNGQVIRVRPRRTLPATARCE